MNVPPLCTVAVRAMVQTPEAAIAEEIALQERAAFDDPLATAPLARRKRGSPAPGR